MKLFASDFDGTLFHRDPIEFSEDMDISDLEERGYRQEDIEAIAKFQKEGNLFGLCTGRSLISAVDFLNKDIHCDFYIVSSGAIVYDKDQNIIYEHPIAHEDAKKVLEMLPEKGLSITTDKEFYIAKGMDFLVKKPVYTTAFDINSDEVVISISANMPNEELAVKTKQALESIEGIAVHQNQHCLDITANGCSKGNGLLKAAQHFGLSEQNTCGIGDSYNDLPLIEQAAISFTFHDAPAAVQAKANHVVNGIAQALDIAKK
jgi:hypothetical protein